VADFAQTILNVIGLFGGKPVQLWGPTMTWGTSTWGNKPDFSEVVIVKIISNSLSLPDIAFAFDVTKIIDAQLITFDSTVAKDTTRTINEAMSIVGDASSQSLQDPNGYFYVFKKPTTDNETTVNTEYTSQSAGSVSFTSQTNCSTVWS